MEPDSTTFESGIRGKSSTRDLYLPFTALPENFKLYQELALNNGERNLTGHIVKRLQNFGLLASSVVCPTGEPTCNVVCKPARVNDRLQWVCDGCGKRQPVRIGSFFYRLQCTILQALQLILAWCEDADLNIAAEHFNIKPKVANFLVERLDDTIIRQLRKNKLGGESYVVLAEMYPDCLNRHSPDTTDQPHVHRILMLADTKHVPTDYRLHVIRETKGPVLREENHFIKTQIQKAITSLVDPASNIVTGNNIPILDETCSFQEMQEYCDVDMQDFLTSRIWQRAVSLCAASRELCAANACSGGGGGGGRAAGACRALVQRYLDAALYRRRRAGDGFYRHVLSLVAVRALDADDT